MTRQDLEGRNAASFSHSHTETLCDHTAPPDMSTHIFTASTAQAQLATSGGAHSQTYHQNHRKYGDTNLGGVGALFTACQCYMAPETEASIAKERQFMLTIHICECK